MTKLVHYIIDDMPNIERLRHAFGITLQTPHMDALVGEGYVNFDKCSCVVPVCGPSRGAMNTGHSPARSQFLSLQAQEWYDWIPTRDNLAAELRRNGFYVGSAGKWMHGYFGQPAAQVAQMFDEQAGAITSPADLLTGPWATNFDPDAPYGCIGVSGRDGQFYDNQVINWMAARLGNHASGPYAASRKWALLCGSLHPHTRYECPKQFYDLYDPAQISEPAEITAEAWRYVSQFSDRFLKSTHMRDRASKWRSSVWGFAASLSHIDWCIGQLVAALKARPDYNDITVVITSDNGFHLGEGGMWNKMTVWDQAVRVPMWIRPPGGSSVGTSTVQVGHMDLYPTVLDYLGLPAQKRLEGQSLRPLIEGRTGYEDRGAISFTYGAVSYARGPYRYIAYPQPGEVELYNHDTDPFGNHNIAADDARTRDMAARCVVECARYGLVAVNANLPALPAAASWLVEGGAVIVGGAGDDRYFVYNDPANPVEILDTGGRNKVVLTGWDESIDRFTPSFTLPAGVQDLTIGVVRSPYNPIIVANDEDNLVFSPSKQGTYYLGAGNDTMRGPGNIEVHGEAGDDYMEASDSRDKLYGGDGDDTLAGASGALRDGGAGNDLLTWSSVAGVAYGGSGDDTVIAGSGDDTIYGGSGDDRLFGGGGNDLVYGGAGSDLLDGGTGNDTLHGGAGDTLIGGAGADCFVIEAAGTVQIGDWEIGEVIDIVSWGESAPQVLGLAVNAVLVSAGTRGVMVRSAGPITPAQVQAALVTA